MCCLDGSRDVAVPLIAADQGLDHVNALWCHLYHAISSAKGVNFFQILPAKQLSISTLFEREFPPIAANKNRPTPFINPNTVAYIFSLIIDSATVHNAESPHARALQYEATVLKVLKSMPADDFRSELRSALISYYDGILKIPGACGRPEAQEFKRSFNARRSVDPPASAAAARPAPPPAARRKCRPCTDMYRHVLPCTLLYFDLYCLVPFRVLPCTALYCPVPLCTQLSTYAYVLFDIFLYWYVPVCTDLYRFATFLK
jgi:hypothetical protein